MRRFVAPQLCPRDLDAGGAAFAVSDGGRAVEDGKAQLPFRPAVCFDDGGRMGERSDFQRVRQDVLFFADVKPHVAVDAAALIPARMVVIGGIDGHSDLVFARMKKMIDALRDADIAVGERAYPAAVDKNFAAAVDALEFKINGLFRPLTGQREALAVFVLSAVIEGAKVPDADGWVARLRDGGVVRQIDALRFSACKAGEVPIVVERNAFHGERIRSPLFKLYR